MLTVSIFRQAVIVQGAALRGLEGLRSSTKRCRRNYGFAWSIPFRPGIDKESVSFCDMFTGEKRTQGVMKWMITKVRQRRFMFSCVWPASG
jgi:hypothetical protein